MNLKEAAQTLGVHYQTAYKWVRSGAIAAVRVGGRYEISEAAIGQFVAGRRSVATAPVRRDEPPRAAEVTYDAVLAELDAMGAGQVLAAGAVTRFVARRCAEVLGDVCLVVLMNRDGVHADHAAIDHPVPERAAFFGALLASLEDRRTLYPNAASQPFFSGRSVRISHIPQDLLRSAVRPSFRQHLAQHSLYSLVSVPILDAGSPVGLVAAARDTIGRPYTSTDEAFLVAVARRVARLTRAARDIDRAWAIRDELAEHMRERVERGAWRRRLTADDVAALLAEHPGSSAFPVAVIGPDYTFLGANDTLLSTTGHVRSRLVGQSVDAVTHPGDRAWTHQNFELLFSGELDFHDVRARCLLADGTGAPYAAHRVAVRDAGADLQCIIGVARPGHLAAATG